MEIKLNDEKNAKPQLDSSNTSGLGYTTPIQNH